MVRSRSTTHALEQTRWKEKTMIPFTQYLRPDGRRTSVEVDRPAEIEQLAERFIAAGGRYECEELTTGHASLTAVHPECETGDCAIAVVNNGPEVPAAVDRVVRRSVEWLNHQRMTSDWNE
jgi:hypothetical protein